jgi:CheY-like chemotaxis protein
VEDDPQQRAALADSLAALGYDVQQAGAAGEALRQLIAEPPEVVVLDLVLPDAHGVELAGAIRVLAKTTHIPIVVVTSYTDAAAALDPARFGAECVLTKPVTNEQLHTAAERCIAPRPGSLSTEL